MAVVKDSHPNGLGHAAEHRNRLHDEQEGDETLEISAGDQDRDEDEARDEAETRNRDRRHPVHPVGHVAILGHLLTAKHKA